MTKVTYISTQNQNSLISKQSPMEWTRGPVIGRGSTATVSLATALPSGELFAVKSVELSRSISLQKEQHFLSQLSCPNVVKYMGFDIRTEDSRSTYNLCMEYVPGGTLHDEILRHGGRMAEPAIRSCTKEILLGLDCLHRNGLVHCDVKSQNILMGSDGAKIADLGFARFEKDSNFVISGTPVFMSPEAARGEAQGFAADVWAVGCTVIEMATGSHPWPEVKDPVSALYRIGFSGDVPELPAMLSEKGIDFLSKCLRKDPEERWTAGELLHHPFLHELEPNSKTEFSRENSPSSVLDRGFWDGLETSESFPGPISGGSCTDSPAGRIGKLVSDDELKWGFDDEDWVTVRSNGGEESEAVMASAMDEEDDVSSVFEDDLFMNYYSSEAFSSIDCIRRGFVEDDNVVFRNFDDQMNEKLRVLQSCVVLFSPIMLHFTSNFRSLTMNLLILCHSLISLLDSMLSKTKTQSIN